MRSPNATGRVIGLLLLLHLIVGLTTPYIILRQLGTALEANPTINGAQVRLAIMLLFIGGALTIAIAITGWSIFREHSFQLAMWLVALAAANFALQCVENAGYMSLFTFSQEYAKTGAADVSLFHASGIAVRTIWKWAHYTHLLIMVSWMFLLGAMLWRSAVMPRALAALLPVASLLQMFGITLPQFISYRSPAPTLMGMTLGITYLVLAVWLIVKGFSQPQSFATRPTNSVAD